MNTLDLGSWCILRMASADTVRLVEALDGIGLGVWTPIERKVIRRPRRRASPDKAVPMMPSYAFGHVDDLNELLCLSRSFMPDHPPFSVMHHRGGIPLIADDELVPLREEEGRLHTVFERFRRKGQKGPSYAKGTHVRLTEGPFEGLPGIVEGEQGQFTLVSFSGFHRPLKISSLLLIGDMAEVDLPCARHAA
jgi:hypothetical protein